MRKRYARAEVKGGDTIWSLAQRLLGDFSRWRDLVTLNKLVSPYVASIPALNVLTPGDLILYPATSLVTTFPPAGSADAEASTYGHDLKLVGGLLVMQGSSLAMTSGLENLRAALERRVNTRVGNLPAHPATYGHAAGSYVGGVLTPAVVGFIQEAFDRCVRADPRVSSTNLGVTSDVEGRVVVSGGVEPITPTEPILINAVI